MRLMITVAVQSYVNNLNIVMTVIIGVILCHDMVVDMITNMNLFDPTTAGSLTPWGNILDILESSSCFARVGPSSQLVV